MSEIYESKKPTKVITIRIDGKLNEHLDSMKARMGISKTNLIKNYLELSKYIIKHKTAIQSLNDRDLVVVKKSYLRKIIEQLEEKEQLDSGDKLARFVNDIARIYGKQEDLRYKIDFCNNLGFFNSFFDDNNYLLTTKKFGPKKFVEAFLFRLFKQKELNSNYIEEEMKSNKGLRQKYKNEIKELDISSSHYSYEFAKIPK